jgi:hypothetical protein
MEIEGGWGKREKGRDRQEERKRERERDRDRERKGTEIQRKTEKATWRDKEKGRESTHAMKALVSFFKTEGKIITFIILKHTMPAQLALHRIMLPPMSHSKIFSSPKKEMHAYHTVPPQFFLLFQPLAITDLLPMPVGFPVPDISCQCTSATCGCHGWLLSLMRGFQGSSML